MRSIKPYLRRNKFDTIPKIEFQDYSTTAYNMYKLKFFYSALVYLGSLMITFYDKKYD